MNSIHLAEKGEHPLNTAERIGNLDPYLATALGLEKFLMPMILLMANLYDKRAFLLTIQTRFRNLGVRLSQLKASLDANSNQSGGPSCSLGGAQPVAQHGQAHCNRLRTECEQEALRIYLSLRVFIDQLRPSTDLASLIVNQYCLMAVIMLGFTLPFCSNTDSHQLMIIGSILVDLVSTMNLAFIICAAFESICVKTIQHSWSLVASMTIDPAQSYGHSLNDTEANRIMALKMRRSRASQPALRTFNEFASENQLGASVINEHTATLWRRFVADMPSLNKNAHCAIFGCVRLNYSGMIRLNFWFISVVLIYLSQQALG